VTGWTSPAQLAHDFRFDRSTERTQLSALLRDHLGGTG
jgi:hypothetical protein